MRSSWMHQALGSGDMSGNEARSWRRFRLVSVGRSQGAQQEVLRVLASWGHREVTEAQDPDYILVFCPISSRAGSDISEAESYMPGDRPVVLVVLHHTFQKDYSFVRSEQIVEKPNVVLTVDLLFHQGELLQCARNQQSWDELSLFIRGVRFSWFRRRDLWKFAVPFTLVVVGIVALTFYFLLKKT